MAEVIEGTAIALREEPLTTPQLFSAMRPAEKVAYATEVAGVLKDVLVKRNLIKRIGQSDHVELEGWQTCGSIVGVSVKVEWTKALADGKGWESRAVVVTANGTAVGAGEGMCSRSESTWAKRDDFAIRAMAQTRAMSRALRGVLAWIVVLAGYKPTPAEEMPDDIPPRPAPQPRRIEAPKRNGKATHRQAYDAWLDATGYDDGPDSEALFHRWAKGKTPTQVIEELAKPPEPEALDGDDEPVLF